MRTFIAIDLDAELKKAVQDLVLKLAKKRADIRWVNFQGMHLTLKFLGEVDESGLASVREVLKKVTSGRPRFSLALRGTGVFPGGKNPRVLWIGILEDPALLALQEDLDQELEQAGFPRESRAFHPHLTLGRVRSPKGVPEAVIELERFRETLFGEMAARKVTLFESLLRPQGAEYRAVEEFVLV